MKKLNEDLFQVNWILNNELAIGPAPTQEKHLMTLNANNIKSIISLCEEKEACFLEKINLMFNFKRIVLPDHKTQKIIDLESVEEVLKAIEILEKEGPIFVHCVAAVERSPLVGMAWLIKKHQLTPSEALDYLMEVNPGTCPLPSQLLILNKI